MNTRTMRVVYSNIPDLYFSSLRRAEHSDANSIVVPQIEVSQLYPLFDQRDATDSSPLNVGLS